VISILANPDSRSENILVVSRHLSTGMHGATEESKSCLFAAVENPHLRYVDPASRGMVKHKIKGLALEIEHYADFIAVFLRDNLRLVRDRCETPFVGGTNATQAISTSALTHHGR
jgi:hypothetical protein